MRGDGWVYLKGGPGRAPRWYLGYWRDGCAHREPAMVADPKAPHGKRPAADEEEAEKCLRATIRGLDRGELVTPEKRRVTINELADGLLLWMRNKKRKSADKVESHLTHIREAFGLRRAVSITSAQVERYKAERLKVPRVETTIDRELETLHRCYTWGMAQDPPLVARVLKITYFRPENARQGFVSAADFAAVLSHVKDPDVRDFIEWFYWTGMRPEETRHLTWSMYDRETETLRLHASAAKIRKGRTLVLAGPLADVIKRRSEARRFDTPLIFHRTSKGRPGQPVKDYSDAWAAACRAAGLRAGRDGGLIPYDLRRTAVRNMVRAGVDRAVAKRISGHRTDSTFERYNITSEEDLREAMEKREAYEKTLPTERTLAKVVGIGEGRR